MVINLNKNNNLFYFVNFFNFNYLNEYNILLLLF